MTKNVKLNKETCFEVAKLYNNIYDLKKHNNNEFLFLLNNNFISECEWLLPKKGKYSYLYWTYERTYNEAKKYKTKNEFKHGENQRAYFYACKNKWINDYTWFKNKKIKWTFEKCKEITNGLKSGGEFRETNKSAYNASLRQNFLEKLFPEKLIHDTWSVEESIEESKKYKNRYSFELGNSSAYNCLLKNNKLDECTWFRKPFKREPR